MRRPSSLNDQEGGDVKQYIGARPLLHDVAVDWRVVRQLEWPGGGREGLGSEKEKGYFGAARGVGKCCRGDRIRFSAQKCPLIS
jgi:hypothetical protein